MLYTICYDLYKRERKGERKEEKKRKKEQYRIYEHTRLLVYTGQLLKGVVRKW